MPNGDPAELERRLRDAVLRSFERYDLALAPAAVRLLDKRIEEAARRVVEEGPPDEGRIEQAERTTVEFATAVMESTFRRRPIEQRDRFDYGPQKPVVADEPDLLAAWAGLCPGFWPWC